MHLEGRVIKAIEAIVLLRLKHIEILISWEKYEIVVAIMNQSHAPGVTTEVLRRNSKEAIWNSLRAIDISMWMYREKVRPVREHYLDTRRCAQLAN